MRSALDLLVGAVAVGALGLLLWLGWRTPAEGLVGVLRGDQPYAVGPRAPALAVGPPELEARLATDSWGTDALRLTTWRVSYGQRWHRSITLPELRGPLAPEGSDVCGIAARISPGVFDPKHSGDGLTALVRRELDRVLPMSLPCGFTENVHLARPKSVSLRMTPRRGAIDLEAVATLPDGTLVGAASTIRLVADAEGRLVVDHVGPVEPLFAGPARARCEGTLKVQLGNLWWRYIKGQKESIVLATARAEMARRVTPALDALNRSLSRLHEPLTPFPGEPHEIALRLARPPEVGPDGVGLRLCARLALGGPRIDPAITGPPLVRSEPPPLPAAATGAVVELALDNDAVNHVIHAMWQTGQLRRWGTSTELLDQLPDDVRGLAFEVTGFDPRLPPILVGDRVVVANVAVGRWGEREVMGHATGAMRLAGGASGSSRLTLSASLDALEVSCVGPLPDGTRSAWQLTPCLSELLPLVSERMRASPPRFGIDTAALIRAVAGHTLHGLRLELSPPEVGLAKGVLSARMSVKVGAAP